MLCMEAEKGVCVLCAAGWGEPRPLSVGSSQPGDAGRSCVGPAPLRHRAVGERVHEKQAARLWSSGNAPEKIKN